MPNVSGPTLSVNALFAERDARRRRDKEARNNCSGARRRSLPSSGSVSTISSLTDAIIQSGLDRIKRAFERGETELMISSFPSSFCTDGGRAIINAGAPPINKPSKEELAAQADEPEWLETLPAGVHQVYDYWKEQPEARRLRFLALASSTTPTGCRATSACSSSWPKSTLEHGSRTYAEP